MFFQFTFSRKGMRMPGKPYAKEGEYDLRIWKNCMEQHLQDHNWYLEQPMDSLTVMSEDQLNLHGNYLHCEKPERIVLCVHGFRGDPSHDVAGVARYLHQHHCDLLFINQRASGQSEGNYITFGAKEKNDIKTWCRYLEAHNPKKLPVYLYGVSMGCTTILCASTLGITPLVHGLIADCGYSSIRSILEAQARGSFHLPPYPVLSLIELLCRWIAKFRFSDGDAQEAMKQNRIPVLFIHGNDDHFVRTENTLRNYEACAAEKELLLVDGATHANSYNVNEQLYQAYLNRFFQKWDNEEIR